MNPCSQWLCSGVEKVRKGYDVAVESTGEYCDACITVMKCMYDRARSGSRPVSMVGEAGGLSGRVACENGWEIARERICLRVHVVTRTLHVSSPVPTSVTASC